jgi:hypothetical protein
MKSLLLEWVSETGIASRKGLVKRDDFGGSICYFTTEIAKSTEIPLGYCSVCLVVMVLAHEITLLDFKPHAFNAACK